MRWKPDGVFLAPHRRGRLSRSLVRGVSAAVLAQTKCALVSANKIKPGEPHNSLLPAPATWPHLRPMRRDVMTFNAAREGRARFLRFFVVDFPCFRASLSRTRTTPQKIAT